MSTSFKASLNNYSNIYIVICTLYYTMFIALFRIVDLFTICTVFRWIAYHKNVHVRGSLFISIHAYIFIYYQGKPSKKAALSPSKQFEKPSVRKKYRRPPKVHSL